MVTDPRARPPQQSPRTGQRPPVAPGYNPIRWRRFWLIFGALLLANIIISTILQGVSQPVSVTIPYDVFIAQVDAGNVVSITATGRQELARIRVIVQKLDDEFFAPLPAESREALHPMLVALAAITSAYFACRSKRLTLWLSIERS